MSQVINTNMASLNAQRNLATNSGALGMAIQRLSSGLRINSAKDDAAGLAISERMSTQIRGANQAARNANDAVSLAQTAEGDLSQIGANLQRIRELAVQAANASNSASDRASLNNEASQLIAEIDRVASNSSFNGIKLLDGSFTAQTFQVGANGTTNDRITVSSISSAKAGALVGSSNSYTTTKAGAGGVNTTALAAAGITVNGFNVGASASDGVSFANGTASGIAKAAAINAISSQTNVTASIGASTLAGTTVTAFATAMVAADVLVNGVDIGAIAAAGSAAARGSQVAGAVNAVTAQTGVTATFNTTTGAVALSAADGRNITVTGAATAGGNDVTSGITAGAALAAGATATATSTITLTSGSSAGITVGGTVAGLAAVNIAGTYTAATATLGAGVSSIDLTSTSGAQSAIAILDGAISSVVSSRASLGAFQNRFASTVLSLQTTSENLTASRSRIQDADFAQETAALTRGQILQQAGTAMLAQANSLPNSVMALLRG